MAGSFSIFSQTKYLVGRKNDGRHTLFFWTSFVAVRGGATEVMRSIIIAAVGIIAAGIHAGQKWGKRGPNHWERATHADEIVPGDYSTIRQSQLLDAELQQLRNNNKYKTLFITSTYGGVELWIKTTNEKNRIYVPNILQMELLHCCHTNLMNTGQARMEESVLKHFT